MKKLIWVSGTSLLVVMMMIMACQKENSKNSGDGVTLKVKLTDAPVQADSVNVEILKVRVNFRNDSMAWVDLNTMAGVYNLLGLQNGIDTLLATGTLPSNDVQEIRFVLGSNNTIVVNGIRFPLTIPSGAESGLKIKVNKQLSGPIDSLLIDFDAALSIHQTGAGDYKLRPVLKIK